MNKKGMTLVELMVYMVLAAMLLAPVIMLVQNSSVTMARDASNVSLRMTGREILNIIYDDLKNTGFKLKPDFSYEKNASNIDNTKFNSWIETCDKATSTTNLDCPETSGDFNYGMVDVSSFIPENKSGSDFYDKLTVLIGGLDPADGINKITYSVDNSKLIRELENSNPATPKKTNTLANNVEALKFRYSDNLADWYDTFGNSKDHLITKGAVQYIKVIMVTRDPKKLAPSNPAPAITLIKENDVVTGYYTPNSGSPKPSEVVLTPTDASLYERHEIVIPIPNNGLFP